MRSSLQNVNLKKKLLPSLLMTRTSMISKLLRNRCSLTGTLSVRTAQKAKLLKSSSLQWAMLLLLVALRLSQLTSPSQSTRTAASSMLKQLIIPTRLLRPTRQTSSRSRPSTLGRSRCLRHFRRRFATMSQENLHLRPVTSSCRSWDRRWQVIPSSMTSSSRFTQHAMDWTPTVASRPCLTDQPLPLLMETSQRLLSWSQLEHFQTTVKIEPLLLILTLPLQSFHSRPLSRTTLTSCKKSLALDYRFSRSTFGRITFYFIPAQPKQHRNIATAQSRWPPI